MNWRFSAIFAQTKIMSSDTSKRYAQRGVSASKEDVHNAIKNIDKACFHRRFAKLYPIIWQEAMTIVW